LPQVNVGTILLLAVAALGGAWAAGLLRAHYEDGQLTLRVLRARRVLARFDLRDTGLLLLLSLMMGWAVAAAVEENAQGELYPAIYVRRANATTEHLLPGHPLHEFQSTEHQRALASALDGLFGSG